MFWSNQSQFLFALIAITLIEMSDGSRLRYKRNRNTDSYRDQGPITQAEMEKLGRLYGQEMANAHRADFVHVGEIGQLQQPIFHPRPPPIEMNSQYRQNQIEDVHLLQNQQLTPAIVKNLLRELLEKLELADTSGGSTQEIERIGSENRCSLHGIWISAISGVAFELQPLQLEGIHNILNVQVVEAGMGSRTETSFITNKWTGTAQVSTESPTTISLILQEKVMDLETEPKTAVFVGQCVVCTGSPTIQGTWVLFPQNQICFQETKPPQADVMYLLAQK